MKKFITAVIIAVAALAFTGCDVNKDKPGTGSITTLEAGPISVDQFTFNASYQYNGTESSYAQIGVFFNKVPNVSADKYMLTSKTEYLQSSNSGKYSVTVDNCLDMVILKTYLLKPGETCYYRAYMRIGGPSSETILYGDEKSFVVPAK